LQERSEHKRMLAQVSARCCLNVFSAPTPYLKLHIGQWNPQSNLENRDSLQLSMLLIQQAIFERLSFFLDFDVPPSELWHLICLVGPSVF